MEINTVIDDVAATPLAQPGKIRTSPSSTTKFIERSLHDLDDLIQQRRLELSALRKSNRQRLNEQFSVVGKTPLTVKGKTTFTTGKTTKLSTFIKTPKLGFEIPEESAQSWSTPVAPPRRQKPVDVIVEETHNSEAVVLNDVPTITSDLADPPPQPVEGYLAKLAALESTVAALQKENEYLVEKCRIVTIEKSKLEDGKAAVEQSLAIATAQLAELPPSLSRHPSPGKEGSQAGADENAMKIYETAATQLGDDNAENKELREKIELLQASCLEWQNSSAMAAKSAFEWEAHCSTITAHFEGLLSEWQSANSALIGENEALKSVIETHNIVPEEDEDDLMAPDGPDAGPKGILNLNVVEAAHPPLADSSRAEAELPLRRTEAVVQIFNKRFELQQRRYAQMKAFQIMKINCYLQVQNKLYKLKCMQYVKDKEAELRRQYSERPSISPKQLPATPVPTEKIEAPPSVKEKSTNRITNLIVLACGQASLWLVLLVIGHWYLRENNKPGNSFVKDFTLNSEL